VRSSSRYLAFAAYLLSLPGALYILLARRSDPFAVYHARQSLLIVAAGVATPLLWAVCAWLLAWVPLVGPVIAVTLFALVLAVCAGLTFSWIAGMVYALQGRFTRVPLVGRWARLPEDRPALAQKMVAESVERTLTRDA